MKNLFRELFRNWKYNTSHQFSLYGVLTSSLFIVLISITVFHNLEKALNSWKKEIKASLILNSETTEEEVTTAISFFKKLDSVNSVNYVDKKTAFKNFRNKFPELIESYTESNNPIPSSLEINIKKTEDNLSVINKITQHASQFTFIEKTLYGKNWMNKYISFMKNIKYLSWVLIAIMILVSLFAIMFSIKNSIIQRKNEIEIFELIGATSFEIKIPYFIEGAFMGLLCSISTFLILFSLTLFESNLFNLTLGHVVVDLSLSFLPWYTMVLLTFISMLLCGVSSYMSASSQMMKWEKLKVCYR